MEEQTNYDFNLTVIPGDEMNISLNTMQMCMSGQA